MWDHLGVTLDVLERYYDSVPRSGARTEDFGPLTLFVREGAGWPYYGRPALPGDRPVSVADVDRVRARMRELRVPEAFEWVHETSPSMRAAVEASGLPVHVHPLMVLDAGTQAAVVPVPAGVSVRSLGIGDPAMESALAVVHLAFGEAGTQVGSAGVAALDAKVAEQAGDGTLERMEARLRAGLGAIAAAVDAAGRGLCAGQHQPVGPVSEVVGVGTLPSARRRGLGLAVTAALVADARSRGVETVFLSANDEDVARIYGRLGFRRVGTAMIAEVG
jgi:ribosomal protein S18 acetylase RimI-like enzyme